MGCLRNENIFLTQLKYSPNLFGCKIRFGFFRQIYDCHLTRMSQNKKITGEPQNHHGDTQRKNLGLTQFGKKLPKKWEWGCVTPPPPFFECFSLWCVSPKIRELHVSPRISCNNFFVPCTRFLLVGAYFVICKDMLL